MTRPANDNRPGDRARVTTFVKVSPQDAFEVFTEEIDAWWRRGPRFRGARPSVLRFEGGAAGRLVETFDDASGEVFEVGRVLAWDPGAHLSFEWRGKNFGPDEITEVDVLFEQMNEGTQVTIEHRGWSALPPKHPARHGLAGQALAAMIGLWWGELATAYRMHAQRQK